METATVSGAVSAPAPNFPADEVLEKFNSSTTFPLDQKNVNVEGNSSESEQENGDVSTLNVRSAELSLICANPLRVIPLLESVMRRGVGALKTKARGHVNYAGVFELIQIICRRHPTNHAVAHAVLDALDAFIDACPPHAVAGPLQELVLVLLAANCRSGSIVAHIFDKFAVMGSTALPCYGIILALKILQPANDVLIGSCIDLMRTSMDKGGIEAMLNCVQALISCASVPWKLGLVKSHIFVSLRSLLGDEDTKGDSIIIIRMAKRFISIMDLLASQNHQVLREMLVLGHHLPLIRAMARLSNDAEIQQLGCNLLKVFSSTKDGRWLVNCPEAYNHIGHCLDSNHVLPVALHFLINMSLTDASWKHIVHSGVVRHVVRCLYKTDSLSPDCLYHCCTLLINLSSHKGWISGALYKAGVHLALRHLLLARLRLPTELLTHAAKVLVNLTSSLVTFVGDGAFALIDADIHNALLDSVIAARRTRRDGDNCGSSGKDAEFASHACWVIANLSQLNEVRHVLVDNQFTSRLIGVIALYATDPRVFTKALQALSAVAASADDKVALGESRVPRAVVQLLAMGRSLPAQLVHALFGVFSSMAFRCNTNKRRLAEQGAHEQILRYMMLYSGDVALQIAACRALFSIGVNDHNKTALLNRKAIETIRRMMGTHRRNVEVLKQGLLVFAGWALVDMESRHVLVDAGCLADVRASLVAMPHVIDIQTLGIIVLLRLARNECNLKRIAEIQAVLLIKQAMERFSGETDIQNCGLTLLSSLCCGIVKKKTEARFQGKGFPSNTLFVRRFGGISRHACPNCHDGVASELIMTIDPLPVNVFQKLVERGWFRRGGVHLFLYASCHASACNTSELRVRLDAFDVASRSSYRRVMKKCSKNRVTVQTIRPHFTDESFELYRRYQMERHGAEHVTPESFRAHVVDTPLAAETIGGVEYGTFHQEYRIDDRLVGVGVIDVLPHAICSVYMYYSLSPDVAKLSLGVYSTLKEIEFAGSLNQKGANVSHYYLGNYNPSNLKLSYKAMYRPVEVFCAHAWGCWLPYDDAAKSDSKSSLFKENGQVISKPFDGIRFQVEGKCLKYRDVLSQYTVDCQDRMQNALALLAGTVGPRLTKRLAVQLEVIDS